MIIFVICQNDFPFALRRTREAAQKVKEERHQPDVGLYVHIHELELPE